MQANDANNDGSVRGRRSLILTVLIVSVTFFWVLILTYTDLPMIALAGIGVLSLLLLSVATAWTTMAFPSRADK